MPATLKADHKTWTITEAKARLSEVLRLVKEEGPQFIGAKKSFVVITKQEWLSLTQPKKPLGLWLIDNMPTVDELELPDRNEPEREVPFQS
ncbi:MAG: type II toxin-antitoxin system prevent-host-death family antitoxin [Methylococcaceae bacterium]|nr:type II toxin-antitoxin system prevent-host-death family antitoxin [Methylococcaceae bacterium]